MKTKTQKHTPSPWEAAGVEGSPLGGGKGSYTQGVMSPLPFPQNQPYAAIAHGNSRDEAQANAHLIAAAPNLLEAAKEARKQMMLCEGPETEGHFQARLQLRAAIDKAEAKS